MISTPSPRPADVLWDAPVASAPVNAVVSVPGSKSATNRALVLAALADGSSLVHAPLMARDTRLMASALERLGATVEERGGDWHVTGGLTATGAVSVDCGLAGTVMRFLPPVAALCSATVRFDGDAAARVRPMGVVLNALRSLGVDIEGDETLPFSVRGTGSVRGGEVTVDASGSSQFVSGLLLAAARFNAGVTVRHAGEAAMPSLPHVAMSVQMLREFGVDVDDSTQDVWRVQPGTIKAHDVDIEPDLSNAAPFLAAALVTGGRVTITHWPAQTTQAGDALREILPQLGATVTWTPEGLVVEGSGSLSGVDLDLHDVGELTPTIAALAALADGPSTLRGIAHLRGHETDRLAALATELTALGCSVTETDDGLHIAPRPLHGGVFATYADHRMATAGAVIGLAVPGVRVADVATTAKTLPDFPGMWASMLTGR